MVLLLDPRLLLTPACHTLATCRDRRPIQSIRQHSAHCKHVQSCSRACASTVQSIAISWHRRHTQSSCSGLRSIHNAAMGLQSKQPSVGHEDGCFEVARCRDCCQACFKVSSSSEYALCFWHATSALCYLATSFGASLPLRLPACCEVA